MKLTIVASNRDRLDTTNSKITHWFLRSLAWQDCKDFELVIADGGSKNYEEIRYDFEDAISTFPIRRRFVQHKIGELFERARLNNVGIRNATAPYVLCTDVDMIFGPNLVSTVLRNMDANTFLESRTMYLNDAQAGMIYSGKIDPINDIAACRIGRTKKRTTAGGLQCTSVENWNKLRGYNEEMVGWGSEDYELLTRAGMAGLKVKWLGEANDVMVFHQSHPKSDIKKDLECQEKNKKHLYNIKDYRANPNGWGGIKD